MFKVHVHSVRVWPNMLCLQYAECIYLVYKGYWVYPTILALFSLAANIGLFFTLRHRHVTMMGLINQRRIMPVVQGGWVRAMLSYALSILDQANGT